MATAVDVCKDIYAAFVAGNIDGVLAHLADDVDWRISTAHPAGGNKKGVNEVRQFFGHLKETIAFAKFHPEQFMASSDGNEVCVFISVEGTSVATGKPFVQDIVHRWNFSPEKATKVQEWVSDHPAFAACFQP